MMTLRPSFALVLVLVLVLVLSALGCGNPAAASLGVACSNNAGCTDGQTCQTSAPGGYCTQPCQTQASTTECPMGGVCTDVAFSGVTMRVCTRICENRSECRTDYQCNGITGSALKSCRPN